MVVTVMELRGMGMGVLHRLMSMFVTVFHGIFSIMMMVVMPVIVRCLCS
jgi:hypothetical protein